MIDRALILSGGGARGAYQAGVWKFLCEQGWKPDLVCGTSVGAINACCIASGLSPGDLEQLWWTISDKSVFKFSFSRRAVHNIRRVLGRVHGFNPLLSNAPLRKTLRRVIDMERLRAEEIQAMITATSVQDGRLRYFSNQDITVDHVVASAAIPVVFPWQRLDGRLYWDGGLMANTPILPALDQGAKEIITVLLAPLSGTQSELPRNRRKAVEWAYELSTVGSAVTALSHAAVLHGMPLSRQDSLMDESGCMKIGDMRIAVVAPDKMLGVSSILDFRTSQTRPLLEAGYADAKNQLGELLES